MMTRSQADEMGVGCVLGVFKKLFDAFRSHGQSSAGGFQQVIISHAATPSRFAAPPTILKRGGQHAQEFFLL
jgi:hypothetical protein